MPPTREYMDLGCRGALGTRGRSLGHAGVQSGPLPVVVQVALGADDKEGRLLPKALPHLQLP